MSVNLLLDIGQSVVDLDFLSNTTNTTGFFHKVTKCGTLLATKTTNWPRKPRTSVHWANPCHLQWRPESKV